MADSIQKIGLQGLQRGMAQAAESAARVTSESLKEDGDIVDPLVDLKRSEVQVKASAQVIKVGSELDDELLDILA